MRRLLGLTVLGFTLLFAGCIGDETGTDEADPASVGTANTTDLTKHLLNFSEPKLIDETRAGGEPVIAITSQGTILVSAHPGSTHYHPSDDPTHVGQEFLTPTSGQSYLWRSTDNGSSWQHVGAPGANGNGPRGAGLGISDPDFTVADDRIYHTDLEALASASVSWSSDDGQTWIEGNPLASHGVVDRQWVASHEDTVYFTANYFAPTPGRHVWASQNGLVWEQRGDIPGDCGADFVAAPQDGTLYAGCGGGVAVSTDDASSWEQRMVPEHADAFSRMTEPAVDGAGNVWTAWESNESELYLAGSPDKGKTWPWVHELSDDVAHALNGTGNLTMVWPWVSAGSEGRVALSVYATPTPPPSDSGPMDRIWSVVSVAVMDADDNETPASHGYVLKQGHHRGPICQSGTACQINSLQGSPNSDRRLGDFFETTIDHQGNLHVAYSDTTSSPDHVISHPGYVKQTGGPDFVVEDSDFVPTQG